MDISAIDRCLDFTRRRKKSLLLLSAVGLSAYGCYKLYYAPSVVQKRKRLVKLLGTLVSVAESMSSSAESISLISKDLSDFLRSDSDEVPASIRQMSKLAQSEEFAASMVKITEALTVGILRGYNSATKMDGDERATDSSFSDRVLDKVFSPAGSGFASVVVGSFARNLVTPFFTKNPSGGNSQTLGSDSSYKWVNIVCSEKCRELIADCVQLFVSTAVAVYLDKTMTINTYDELFSGMTNPKHESKVKEMLVSVCSGAVETLVKTSHQVFTVPDSNSSSNTSNSSSPSAWNTQVEKSSKFSAELKFKDSLEQSREVGWVNKVSTTLAVPSNRMFLLDVTGRVTFETVRSFLDFFAWKLSNGLKRGVSVVHGEVAGRGLELMRYAEAKSALIATVCFALCLHVFLGTRLLASGS